MPKSSTSSVLSGFLETVETETTFPGGKCHIGKLLEALEQTDRDILLKALVNLKYSGTAIAKALNKNGLAASILGQDIGENSVQRHRRHACRCQAGE